VRYHFYVYFCHLLAKPIGEQSVWIASERDVTGESCDVSGIAMVQAASARRLGGRNSENTRLRAPTQEKQRLPSLCPLPIRFRIKT